MALSRVRSVRLARLARATAEAEVAWRTIMAIRDKEIDLADYENARTREIARACNLAPATILRVLARVERRRL